MGASATFENTRLAVEPGGQVQTRLRVRNTGTVVDSFTFAAVGVPDGWVTFEPAELRLFPETEEYVTVRVSPPRAADTPLGELTFAVRVVSVEDPDGSVAEELTVVIAPFGQRFGELHPKTSTGRLKGVHELAVDNFGNATIHPEFAGVEPDGNLTFEIKPPEATVEPGTAAIAVVTVRARRRFWRGQPKSWPFQVSITDGDNPPELVDGVFVQQALLPKWFFKALLALLALLLLAWILWKTLLEPTVESTARDSVEEAIAEQIQPIEDRLDAAGIPPAPPGGGGGEPTTTTTPVAVPVTTEPGAATTTTATTEPGATTTTTEPSTETTTTTTLPPITDEGPFDFRLVVFDQPLGDPAVASQAVAAGTQLEITDIVFQNPTGATGELVVLRSGSELFTVQLANFRDLDYHFVAPYVFKPGETIDVMLICASQGTLEPRRDEPSPGACRAAVSFAGYTRGV